MHRLRRHGHGHHKCLHRHKQTRVHYFRRIEVPFQPRGRRCLSETDLSSARQNADVEEQIRQIVRAFFRRRHHWGHWGLNVRAVSNEGGQDGVHHGITGRDTDRHHGRRSSRRRSRHGSRHRSRGGSRQRSRHGSRQGRDDSGSEGKEMDESNAPSRHRHHHELRAKRFRRRGSQGRSQSSSSSSSSSSESEGRKTKHNKKKRYNKKRGHGRRRSRSRSRGHRRLRYCGIVLVDAATMTDESGDAGATYGNEIMENATENFELSQEPKSPEVQEVTENLRNSSLE